MKVLDEIEIDEINNKKLINKLLLISIGTIILLIIFEKLRVYLPENLIDTNGTQINTAGLMLIAIIITFSIIIPSVLDKFKPKMSLFQIVIVTGLILFAIEFCFKIIQNAILFRNGLNLEYFDIFKLSAGIGIVGILIANIRIHKIRRKKTMIAWVLLIIVLTVNMILLKE